MHPLHDTAKNMSTPNYEELSIKLFEAMKGLGSDKKVIIEALAQLTSEQICRDLSSTYQQKYNKNLAEHLKSETSGDLSNCIQMLLTPRYTNWAKVLFITAAHKKQPLHVARFAALIDHQDRFRIVECFQQATDGTEEDFYFKIKDENTKAYVKAVLQNEYQITPEGIDQYVAICKTGTSVDQIFEFITTLDQSTVSTFNEKFETAHGESFEQFVAAKFEKLTQLVEIHFKALSNPVSMVAELLYLSVKGMGTDEEVMNYTTAIFRDYHWKDLVQTYASFGDLLKDLKGDLSGAFEDCILRLWGLAKF